MASEPLRLPIAQQLETRDGALAKDSLMVNALAEAGEGQSTAFKRPGATLRVAGFSHATGGIAQGMTSWKGKAYSIDGGVVQQWAPAGFTVESSYTLTGAAAGAPVDFANTRR